MFRNSLISVIVPVYNVEKYLPQCLNSIINQTYENLEIILINDGSTDNSGNICDEYAKRNSRIKAIHKENGGASSARNIGLDICKGDYIGFVDSDDWIELDMYESLYKYMREKDVDITCFGFSYAYINKNLYHNSPENFLYSKNPKFMYEIFSNQYYGEMMCNKLFKKFIFDGIRFPENKMTEDAFIFFDILEKVNGVYISAERKYFYRMRDNSVTHSEFNPKLLDCLDLNEYFLKLAYTKYQLLIPKIIIKCLRVDYFVLSKLVISKQLSENYRTAIYLQKKMRKNINSIIKTSELNIIEKIGFLSLIINFNLFRYLLKSKNFMKLLIGKKMISYP